MVQVVFDIRQIMAVRHRWHARLSLAILSEVNLVFPMEGSSNAIRAVREMSATHLFFKRITELSPAGFGLPHCCGLYLSPSQHGSQTAVDPDCLAGDPRVRWIQ